MSKTQMKIGNALLKSLLELHESKGEVKLEDVGAIFENMASTLHADAPPDSFLRAEIAKLALYIAEAKREIFAIAPSLEPENDKSATNINVAGLELSEVVKATEEATNTILDATDEIIKLAGATSDKESGIKTSDAANRIYDACTFQDITGQRINKVARTLEHVELKVNRLVHLFSDSSQHIQDIDKWNNDEKSRHDKRPDALLMNGPSLTNSAPSQDEIDKLFGSIKG
ncbi:MAG: protein phosphatase CheZ [Rickettsiales bacterium]|nr:protein phosphatase CheZ [Rickettsiales bacterium]